MLIDWFTVLAQFINFIILIYLLKRFLYGPITRAMEARENSIAAAISHAEKNKAEAEKLSRELAKEKQALIEAKAQHFADVKKEVAEWRDKKLNQARLEIDASKQAWMNRLAKDREAFLTMLKTQIANLVLEVSEKVLLDMADEHLEQQIIRVFLKKLDQETEKYPIKDISGQVLIQSGFKINDDLAMKIRQQISIALPSSKSFKFELLSGMGMGVCIMAGDRKIQWNLVKYLDELEKGILKELFILNSVKP